MPSSTEPTAALAVVATTAEVLGHPEADERLLSPAERERAAQFGRESSRLDFVAAHLLVRLCAGRLLSVPATAVTLVQHCDDCAQEGHGKPYLADHRGVHVSISHTRGVVAAAAGHLAVGVDVELRAHRQTDPAVLQRVLTEDELRLVEQHDDPQGEFLRQWVRKEALVKVGRASLASMRELDLSRLRFTVDVVGASMRHSRFEEFHVLDVADEQRGALASVVSRAPVRLSNEVAPRTAL